MVYATVSDYLSWTDVASAPLGLSRVLTVASTRVDEMLVGVVYDVDTAGRPTDLDVAELLRNVTCEQALYMLEVGDTTGAGSFTELTVGRVSWQQGAGSSATQPSRFSPEAQSMLHVAGLVPVYVIR